MERRENVNLLFANRSLANRFGSHTFAQVVGIHEWVLPWILGFQFQPSTAGGSLRPNMDLETQEQSYIFDIALLVKLMYMNNDLVSFCVWVLSPMIHDLSGKEVEHDVGIL